MKVNSSQVHKVLEEFITAACGDSEDNGDLHSVVTSFLQDIEDNSANLAKQQNAKV